jgi:2-oxoisovalerate dehydrogenase E1 component alpha subunit
MASTLETPMIFLCRNNGYAISTPVSDQYRGDGIISRAAGYGMRGIRVDGNDVFAIYESVKEARRIALEHKCPVLVEVMTYRGGHHSTSDDSTRYRNINEMKNWSENYNPLKRFKSYLLNMKYWNDNDDTALNDRERMNIIVALETAEKRPKPSIKEMFNDVYSDKPKNLIHQEKELYEHIRKYPNHYNIDH